METTLRSLRRAGWTGSITLFAEPNAILPVDRSALIVVQRQRTLGAWPNWWLGLSELHLARPHADAYLMIQDDALFVRGLRRYLERNLWPARRLGVVSLHTPSHQARTERAGFFQAQVGWGAWGAMAFVFPNAAARALLHDARVINHRSRGMGEGLKNVDSVIGDWCQRKQLPFFLHAPSLCQHIGLTTTLWSRDSLEGRRAAADFPGESVDINDMMKAKPNDGSRKSFVPDKSVVESASAAKTLAMVTVHIGRRHCFPDWENGICQTARAATPLREKPALLVVDNSADSDFRVSHLEPLLEKLRRDGSLSHGRILEGPGPRRSSKRLDLARMQSFAKALTRGIEATREDLVLTIDDDVVPPPDAIGKLIEAYRKLTDEGHSVGAISGCYESATAPGFLVATRPGCGWEARFRMGELEADEIVEAGTVGNGCCLVNGKALRALLPIEVTLPNLGRVGPDGYLCRRIRQAGRSVWLHGGVVCEHRFREGVSSSTEPKTTLDLRVREPGILFDLGFHHGSGFHKLMMMLGLSPAWQVEIFEPNPSCCESLEIFARNFPSARVHRTAVWTSAGEIALYRENRSKSGSRSPQVNPANTLDGWGSTIMQESRHPGLEPGIAVPCVDFSTFLRETADSSPKRGPVVVKMDIEGAEFPVLRKLLNDGTASLIDLLFVEFHQRFLPGEDDRSVMELTANLQSAGVEVYPWN